MNNPTSNPTPAGDQRFTLDLIADVFGALEAHGYTAAGDAATERALGALLTLVETYEGRRV